MMSGVEAEGKGRLFIQKLVMRCLTTFRPMTNHIHGGVILQS